MSGFIFFPGLRPWPTQFPMRAQRVVKKVLHGKRVWESRSLPAVIPRKPDVRDHVGLSLLIAGLRLSPRLRTDRLVAHGRALTGGKHLFYSFVLTGGGLAMNRTRAGVR